MYVWAGGGVGVGRGSCIKGYTSAEEGDGDRAGSFGGGEPCLCEWEELNF